MEGEIYTYCSRVLQLCVLTVTHHTQYDVSPEAWGDNRDVIAGKLSVTSQQLLLIKSWWQQPPSQWRRQQWLRCRRPQPPSQWWFYCPWRGNTNGPPPQSSPRPANRRKWGACWTRSVGRSSGSPQYQYQVSCNSYITEVFLLPCSGANSTAAYCCELGLVTEAEEPSHWPNQDRQPCDVTLSNRVHQDGTASMKLSCKLRDLSTKH